MLKEILIGKRTIILEDWLKLVSAVFTQDAILKSDNDRFSDPASFTIGENIKMLYDELTHDADFDKLAGPMGDIIQVAVVQDITPSVAISFIFGLKQIIRETAAEEVLVKELLEFETQLDRLALLAFDRYTYYLGKVYQIRLNQMKIEKENVLTVLERANRPGAENRE